MVESWVLLSLSAALIWSFVNTFDKFVLVRWTKDPQLLVMALNGVGLVAALIIFSFVPFPTLSLESAIAFLGAGAFLSAFDILYYHSVKIEEVSRVLPLSYLDTVFIALFAWMTLGETFAATQYAGVALLVVGGMLISTQNVQQLRFSKALHWMVLAALLLALGWTMSKRLIGVYGFWSAFALTRVTKFVALAPVFLKHGKSFAKTVKSHGAKTMAFIVGNESLNLIAILLLYMALSLGPITLSNALAATEPFFVLLIASAWTLWNPKDLKEKVAIRTVAQKLLAIALIFSGVLLIT